MASALQDRLQAALGNAYRVEHELARGGMSYLFLATEVSLNRKVVVKVLPPEMASAVSAARFRKEIEVAAHLAHPHILPVLTTGARGDLLYFTMPYVEGESLRHRISREGPLPLADALRILRETADALAFAHERGVVHRDIKPENILLQGGHAVLADFGVARAVQEARENGSTRLTADGAAIGTPGYMSPEQAAGEPHIDARADIYALAVVGYEMLSGEPPFTGPTLQAILTAHLTETPPSIQSVRPEVPIGVAAALERGLAKEPDERFQSAAQFRDALLDAHTPATPTVPVTAVRRRRRRRTALGAAALLAIGTIGTAVALWPRGYAVEGDPRKSIIVFPFENLTGRAELDYLEEASMNLLGLSLGHWRDLRLYDDERTASLMRRREVTSAGDLDFARAQAMARDAGVGTLVLGDIRREGDSLAVEAKIHDVASGERLRLSNPVIRTALDGDPRPLFDSLASRLLQISGAPAGAAPGVVAQTTQNLDAYRAYLAGTDALQRFETDSARMYLERAIALDSGFALAYVQLRNVAGWSNGGDPIETRTLIANAEAHSDRLPPRLRDLVRFHAAYEAGDYRRARGIAEELLARDSTDVEAWYQYGEAHWHDNSGQFPRPTPDTLGNLGVALHAFRQALALDANYLIAYQHIIDALGNCATFAIAICVGDSAVYGTAEALEARFGAARIARLREDARSARLRAAYDWVTAAPRAMRTRNQLVNLLLNEERYDEAMGQARVLRSQGHEALGLAWEANILYAQRRLAEAADRMGQAVVLADDSAATLTGLQAPAFGNVGEVLAAGGRVTEGFGAVSLRAIGFPGDSVGGNTGLMPKSFYAEEARFLLEAHYGLNAAEVREATRRWLTTLRRATASDSAQFNSTVSSTSWAMLSAYLTARDTVPVAELAAAQDTASATTWRVARAILALERGDTAETLRRIRRDWATPGEFEFSGIYGVARAAAWADLLTRLGRLEDAIRTYEILDTIPAVRGGLLVRAWADLGALYQRTGNRDRAAEMYRRVAEAWGDGDPAYREVADRARRAIAALEDVAPRPSS